MPIQLQISVPNPDDILAGFSAGALIRVERAATEDGVYAEIDTEAVVAATYVYEVWDPAGTATSWYRTRYSNAANTLQSDYGSPFGPAAPSTYATVDELVLTFRQVVTQTLLLNRVASALREANRDLNRELGFDFFRHPVSGTEQRIYHGTGRDILHVHEGIVDLTTVEIKLTEGAAWTTLDADNWYVEAEPDAANPAPGEPWFHVRLFPLGTYKTFPQVRQGVRLTLAWGWPAVLADAKGAELAWARAKLAADPTFPGNLVGHEELGQPVGPNRLPDAVWRLLTNERHRHWCHL